MQKIANWTSSSALVLALAACGSQQEPAPATTVTATVTAAPETAAATPAQVASPVAAKADVGTKGNGRFRMPNEDELANGVNANCDIAIDGTANGSFEGPCKFNAEGGASFWVEHAQGYPIIDEMESIYIEADTPLIARAIGKLPDGTVDLGIVKRKSTKDACWQNATARICAWAAKFK